MWNHFFTNAEEASEHDPRVKVAKGLRAKVRRNKAAQDDEPA